jgi:hypothetical protein
MSYEYELAGLGAVSGAVVLVEGRKAVDLADRLRSSSNEADAAAGDLLKDLIGSRTPDVIKFVRSPNGGMSRSAYARGYTAQGSRSPSVSEPAAVFERAFMALDRLPQLTDAEFQARVAALTAQEPTPARQQGDGLLPSSTPRGYNPGGSKWHLVAIGGAAIVGLGVLWWMTGRSAKAAAVRGVTVPMTANRGKRRRRSRRSRGRRGLRRNRGRYQIIRYYNPDIRSSAEEVDEIGFEDNLEDAIEWAEHVDASVVVDTATDSTVWRSRPLSPLATPRKEVRDQPGPLASEYDDMPF